VEWTAQTYEVFWPGEKKTPGGGRGAGENKNFAFSPAEQPIVLPMVPALPSCSESRRVGLFVATGTVVLRVRKRMIERAGIMAVAQRIKNLLVS